jgi:hypothetical protein
MRCNDEASEVNVVEIFNLSAAAFFFRHPTVANYFTVDLAELKELS